MEKVKKINRAILLTIGIIGIIMLMASMYKYLLENSLPQYFITAGAIEVICEVIGLTLAVILIGWGRTRDKYWVRILCVDLSAVFAIGIWTVLAINWDVYINRVPAITTLCLMIWGTLNLVFCGVNIYSLFLPKTSNAIKGGEK